MKKVTKGVRIVALLCVVLLLSMYVATLIAALTAKPYSSRMFMGCVLCTVFVPIFLHILTRLFAMMSERREGDTTLHELHQARKRARTDGEDAVEGDMPDKDADA